MCPLTITAIKENLNLEKPFVIARGSRKSVDIIVVEISNGELSGRGECCPTLRYGHRR